MPSEQREHRAFRNVARVVGKIGKEGEVKVEPIDNLPFLLDQGMLVYLNPPKMTGIRSAVVKQVREVGEAFGVVFEGCDDSAQAFDLVGRLCLVACDDLGDLGDEDDPQQLVGAKVVDSRLGDLGRINDVLVNPMQALLVVGTEEQADRYLIPLVEEYVRDFDGTSVRTQIPDDLANLNASR